MYGKVPTNAFQSGLHRRCYPDNPMYGKYGITPTNALTVNVYSLDNQLVRSFSSKMACAKGPWVGVSEGSVRNYIRSGA